MVESIVKFDEKGDGPARYTILNYQKNPESNGYDYKVSHCWCQVLRSLGEPVVTTYKLGSNQAGVQPGAFLPLYVI